MEIHKSTEFLTKILVAESNQVSDFTNDFLQNNLSKIVRNLIELLTEHHYLTIITTKTFAKYLQGKILLTSKPAFILHQLSDLFHAIKVAYRIDSYRTASHT